MNRSKRSVSRGALLTILGGICWGFSGTCGQYLFSEFDVSPLWLTSVRILTAGIIMFLIALPRRHREMRAILKVPKDAATLFCYGAFGLLLCQYAYMVGISHSNAATTTVLQTLNLVFIMLITCVRLRRRPDRREGISLICALFGTYMLATGGNPTQLVISPQGLFWGLAAAAAVTTYSLIPQGLLQRWSRETVNACGMLIAGIVLNLLGRSWTIDVSLPLQGWLAVGCIILLGTVVAFSLFVQGIKEIGPVRASMLAATEPVSATVFSMLWLGTSFRLTDFIGFGAILLTIFLLAKEA